MKAGFVHLREWLVVVKDCNVQEVLGARNASRIFNIPRNRLNELLTGKRKSYHGYRIKRKESWVIDFEPKRMCKNGSRMCNEVLLCDACKINIK